MAVSIARSNERSIGDIIFGDIHSTKFKDWAKAVLVPGSLVLEGVRNIRRGEYGNAACVVAYEIMRDGILYCPMVLATIDKIRS